MTEFFAMGGYAFHVWTCWSVSFVLLGGLAIARQKRLARLAELAQNSAAQSGDERGAA